jgi:hypothetical protein
VREGDCGTELQNAIPSDTWGWLHDDHPVIKSHNAPHRSYLQHKAFLGAARTPPWISSPILPLKVLCSIKTTESDKQKLFQKHDITGQELYEIVILEAKLWLLVQFSLFNSQN